MKTFGEILKEKRIEKGYYQTQVSKIIGARYSSSISQYELNKHKPSLLKLKKLCDLYVLDFKEMTKLAYGYEIEYNFSNIIKLKRQELKMTKQQVANILGLSKSAICDYETNKISDIPAKVIYKLCEFYKLDYDEMMDICYPIEYSSLGAYLKTVRKRLGYKRSDIENILGYSTPYLSGVENNFRNPDYKRLYNLCDLYKLDFNHVCEKYFNDDINSLGFELKIARVSKNIQQIEVSNLLNITPQMISSVELNRVKPNYKLVRNLCRIYDIDLNNIYKKYYNFTPDDSLGLQLRHMRYDKDLSIKQVADLVGISDTTICNYELNKSKPNKNILKKIYRVYGIIEE